MAKRLILASASPRRRMLLEQLGVSCEVIPADVDESAQDNETAQQQVARLALAKCEAVVAQHPDALILAADTLVYLSGPNSRVFGKPKSEEDAVEMLACLSDSVHQVATGLALYDGSDIRRQVVVTDVTFASISKHAALSYWHSGEPVGKAGAYAIQGLGARFVVGIRGSYSNVVGLPLYETSVWLTQAGLHH